jgi:hypothetical protein
MRGLREVRKVGLSPEERLPSVSLKKREIVGWILHKPEDIEALEQQRLMELREI